MTHTQPAAWKMSHALMKLRLLIITKVTVLGNHAQLSLFKSRLVLSESGVQSLQLQVNGYL